MKKKIALKDVFPGRGSKYHNRKVRVGSELFDSMKEAARWGELKLLERTGEIQALRRQVPFQLIPAQKDEKGKVIEREVKYIADFVYWKKGSMCPTVEDVKGVRTDVYKLKRKLMLYINGIRIKEV